MNTQKDYVLIVWIITVFLWDVFLIAGTSYLVFWQGHSGWWFVLAIILGANPTTIEILKKRYL